MNYKDKIYWSNYFDIGKETLITLDSFQGQINKVYGPSNIIFNNQTIRLWSEVIANERDKSIYNCKPPTQIPIRESKNKTNGLLF